MTNTVNHLYTVTNLTTGKVVTLGSILEISMHTGYGAGFLSTRIRPHRGDGVYKLDHWLIEFRKRNKGENYLIDTPDNARKIDLTTSLGYSIFIGQIGDINYYVTTEKQLQKSRFRKVYNKAQQLKMLENPNKVYRHNYGVEHLVVTEQDYAMFDLEKEYQEKIVDWRNKPMYLDDIELVNQLIDDILIIKKRKKNTKQFGRASIR
jgi:hypothetical protein